MNPADPNLVKVELIAQALGPLKDELVFVGGCAAGLLITDPAAAPVRLTYDIDLVAEVAALQGYHRMEKRFSQLGFVRDLSNDAPICRWRYRDLVVDLMPSDERILGFANRWYPLAMKTSMTFTLPPGTAIRLVAAPVFIATKFEAFADRGREDVLESHDLEDIINVIDGRPQLTAEIERMESELRQYLASRCESLLALPHFLNTLPGMLAADETSPDRAAVVAARLERIASIGRP